MKWREFKEITDRIAELERENHYLRDRVIELELDKSRLIRKMEFQRVVLVEEIERLISGGAQVDRRIQVC